MGSEALTRVFAQYCAFGDNAGAQSGGMTSRNFVKLAKDSGLVDKKLTLTVLDIAFTKASRSPSGAPGLDSSWGGKRITFAQFQLALKFCAEEAGTTANDLMQRIIAKADDGPTVTATVAAPNKFYDDKSTWTAVARGEPSKALSREDSMTKLPVAKMPSDNKGVFIVFERYCRFGESRESEVLGLTSRNWVKLMKDVGLADGKKLTQTFLDLTFTKAIRAPVGGAELADATAKRINYGQFLIALELCAAEKGVPSAKLHKQIADKTEEGPIMQATVAAPNRFHDDPSTWTAVAREMAGVNLQGTTTTTKQRHTHTIGGIGHAVTAADRFQKEPRRHSLGGVPTPAEPANRAALLDVFEQYARFGENRDAASAGGLLGMTSRNFVKLAKDSGLISKTITPTFLDLAFTKATRAPSGSAALDTSWGGKRISFNQFLVALEIIAHDAGKVAGELHSTILLKAADGPVVQATKAAPNRFHDDPSTYTAVARNLAA